MPKRVPTHRPRALPGVDRHREYNRGRRDPTLGDIYGRAPWKRFRAMVKAERVLCERCKAEGRLVDGKHVDHLIDPRQRPDLIYALENVQLLCIPCHNVVTASRKNHKPGAV